MTLARLAQGWAIATIIIFFFMLFHQSTPPTVLGRYSPNFVMLLAVMLFLAAGFYVMSTPSMSAYTKTLALAHRSLWQQGFWLGAVSIGLGVFWVQAPITSIEEGTQLFRIYVATTIIVWGALPLAGAGIATPFQLSRFVPIAIAVVLGVALTFLHNVPPSSYYDEGFVTSWAVTWAQTGNGSVSSMSPYFVSPYTFLGLLPIGLFADVFGITEFNARLASVVMGWLGLPFLFLATKHWFGAWVGYVAVAMLGLLSIEVGYVRSDTLSSASLALALWATVKAQQEKKSLWHLGVGVALAFTIEGNHLALRFALAWGAWYVLMVVYAPKEQRKQAWLSLLYLVLGGLGYAGVYLLVRMVSSGLDPLAYWTDFQRAYQAEILIGGGMSLPERLAQSITSGFTYFIIVHPVMFACVVVGSIYALMSKQQTARFLLFVFYVSSAFYFLINPKAYHVFYVVHALPLIVLLLGAVLAALPQRLGVALSLLVLVLTFAQLQRTNQMNDSVDELIEIGHQINALLPEGAQKVVGWEIYYWGLHQRDFSATYGVWSGNPDAVVISPDAVIITNGLDGNNDVLQAYVQEQRLIKSACFPISTFGRQVELYTSSSIVLNSDVYACEPTG